MSWKLCLVLVMPYQKAQVQSLIDVRGPGQYRRIGPMFWTKLRQASACVLQRC